MVPSIDTDKENCLKGKWTITHTHTNTQTHKHTHTHTHTHSHKHTQTKPDYIHIRGWQDSFF